MSKLIALAVVIAVLGCAGDSNPTLCWAGWISREKPDGSRISNTVWEPEPALAQDLSAQLEEPPRDLCFIQLGTDEAYAIYRGRDGVRYSEAFVLAGGIWRKREGRRGRITTFK